jgi:hypothetical protein
MSVFFQIFCLNVKDTRIRAIVDSVIIILKILNQEIVAICICNKLRQKNSEVPQPCIRVFSDFILMHIF